jgi:hypothetical protein
MTWRLLLTCALLAPAALADWFGDFGPANQRLAEGAVPVTHDTVYTAARGYGWQQPWGFDFALPDGDPLRSDGIGGRADDRERSATFMLDQPKGEYWLTVWLGSHAPTEGREGLCLEVNGKVVLAPPGVGGWGRLVERRLPVVAEGSQLAIRFFTAGNSPTHRLSAMGLRVMAADPGERAAVRLAWDKAPTADEVLGRTLTVGGRTLAEVGRRREVPLGPLPAPWQDRALLVFTRPNPGDLLAYSIPTPAELTTTIAGFTTPGEVVPLHLAVHAVREVTDIRLAISDLTGPAGRLPREAVELFTVTTHAQSPTERAGKAARLMPELLERHLPFALAAGTTQPLYLRVTVPAAQPPGTYTGTLTLAPGGLPPQTVQVTVRVLPLTLQTPPDKVWHLYTDSTRWFTMAPRAVEREVEDMVAHGITSLSASYPPLSGAYIEHDGRLVDAYYGRVEEALRHAVQQGLRGPLLIGGMEGITGRFRGWNLSQRDGATAAQTAADGGRLTLRHPTAASATSLGQTSGVLLSPGESVRLAVRYRLRGSLRGQVGLRFQISYKRDPVETGRIALPLVAGDGWQEAWGVSEVPEGAPYAVVFSDFQGAGELELDAITLTPATRADLDYLVNGSFAREFAPLDLNQPWPAAYTAHYQDALRSLARMGERLGLPVYLVGTDEAGNNPANAAREIAEIRAAKTAGLRTWCNLAPHLVEPLTGALDATCFYADMLGDAEHSAQLLAREHAAGRQLYTIAAGTYEGQDVGTMPNRYHVGHFFWRSGLDGTAIWTFQRWERDPYDDFDGTYRDHCLVYPPRTPDGEPVPTLAWEGIREGVTDYRYLYTLEQAVIAARAAGQTAAANQGDAVLAFARHTIPWYKDFDPAVWDDQAAQQLRWLVAWTLLQMTAPTAAPAAAPASAASLAITQDETPPPPEPPLLACPPIPTAPTLDGSLDDDVWRQALVVDDFQVYTQPGQRPAAATTLYLLHDRQALYLGLRCSEPAMGELLAAATDHDGNVFADDSLEIFLDTNHDGFSYYQFALNAAGTRFESRNEGSNSFGQNIFQVAYGVKRVRDASWQGEWQAKTQRFADRWEAEIVLPFATIGRASDLMGLLVGRNRKAGARETSSLPAIGMFHQPERFRPLLLTGARTGEARISALALPQTRAGNQRGALTLKGEQKFTIDIMTTVGELPLTTKSQATGGTAELAYALPVGARTVTLDVRGAAGAELYRLATPLAVPARLELLRGPAVLAQGGPPATYRVAVRVSEADRDSQVIRAVLRQGGQRLAAAEAAVRGEDILVALTHGALPPGFYELGLELSPGDQSGDRLVLPLALLPDFAERETP